MAHQLVRQRPAHALDENRVVRVLEHAAVPLLLDVLEVFARRALRRIVLAHVAQPAGEFREPLAVGAVADPGHRQDVRAPRSSGATSSVRTARSSWQDIRWGGKRNNDSRKSSLRRRVRRAQRSTQVEPELRALSSTASAAPRSGSYCSVGSYWRPLNRRRATFTPGLSDAERIERRLHRREAHRAPPRARRDRAAACAAVRRRARR